MHWPDLRRRIHRAEISWVHGAHRYQVTDIKTRTSRYVPADIMRPQESALQVRGLTKRFDRLAVDALDLTVRTGEFYALVGPNGAGKTTTLRMVAGLLPPDAGTVAVFGVDALCDPVAAKQMM